MSDPTYHLCYYYLEKIPFKERYDKYKDLSNVSGQKVTLVFRYTFGT